MEETILTWNVTNWITVVIMATLGFLVLALVAQLFHKATGGKYANAGRSSSQYSATPAVAAVNT